jgi:hypothetical protein
LDLVFRNRSQPRTAVMSAELAFVHLGHLWFHLGDLFVIISLKE